MQLTRKERERVAAVTKALAPFAVGDTVRIGKEYSHLIKAKYVGAVGRVYSIMTHTHHTHRGGLYGIAIGAVILYCHKDAIHYATEEEIANHTSK